MTVFTTDQWIILGLVFLLGLLVGAWMTSGGRRKWKTRYNEEVTARKALETKHNEREAHWSTREKEWHAEQERREAAMRSAPPVAADRREPFVEDRMRDRHPDQPRRDLDRDGVPDQYDRRPLDDRR
ncbi:hypothetical protein [Sphingomonas sp. LHG3406-1]|uniref:hypothetical protein n=1 Tax=Sphingomonas sp. LHG3406-1 TaxID=2804617 RepID=UPI002634CE57|nr:hypothetical protein [Sphingomonas sp. LHG3406-1]